MAESAALLVEEVFPKRPIRQWVLSFPYPLRFLFARRPEVMGRVLGIVYRCIATHLTRKAGFSRKTSQTGAVTLIQRKRCDKDAPNAPLTQQTWERPPWKKITRRRLAW